MATCICGQDNFKNKECITCNHCHRFIHLECANLQQFQVNEICVFYCHICRPYTGSSQLKSITNTHRNNRNEENAEMLPMQTGTPDFISFMKKNNSIHDAKTSDVRKMRGQQVTLKELITTGFDKPILVETKDGLELTIEPNFSFPSVMIHFPEDYVTEAKEITRQIAFKVKLSNLMKQFSLPIEERQDVYFTRLDLWQKNCELGEKFTPPRIVRKLSWVDLYWPHVPFKPSYCKYLFIAMENAYMDFHIDIGATSTWHYVIEGEQTLYLIEPTKTNLGLYQEHVHSSNKSELMFFTKVDKIFKMKVSAGETIFIPNGWIYAILYNQDSLVFGGYFLHSLNIATQLSIYDFLQKLNLPESEFPSYELTNWYAAPNIFKFTKESLKNHPPKHMSDGIEALIEKLRYWLNKSKSKRNEAQALVPRAVNCWKIIRDLKRCLHKKDKKVAKDKIKKIIPKDEQAPPKAAPLPLNPEEAKIKDLISKPESSSSSNLKLTFNMKLAKDVIRRSLDDPYDINESELLLLDSKPSKKKRKHKDEEEIKRMVEGRPQDDDYIYLDLETPEENRQAIKKSNDKAWEPGASNSKPKIKPKPRPSVSFEFSTKKISKPDKPSSSSAEAGEPNTDKTVKKPKKGLATPKQRLAKKLRMMSM